MNHLLFTVILPPHLQLDRQTSLVVPIISYLPISFDLYIFFIYYICTTFKNLNSDSHDSVNRLFLFYNFFYNSHPIPWHLWMDPLHVGQTHDGIEPNGRGGLLQRRGGPWRRRLVFLQQPDQWDGGGVPLAKPGSLAYQQTRVGGSAWGDERDHHFTQ